MCGSVSKCGLLSLGQLVSSWEYVSSLVWLCALASEWVSWSVWAYELPLSLCA